MAKVLQLPHGPWKQIFSGVWEGREVSYHENPEKRLLALLYEKKGEEVKGIVMIMTGFFFVDGNPSNFALNSKENVILIEKNTPSFKGSFLAVSTDPRYVMYSPRQIINDAHEMYNDLDKRCANVRRETANYPFKIVGLQYAALEQVHELLGEPLAIPAITVRKVGPRTVITSNLGHVKIGKSSDGSNVEEPVQSAMLTVITGGAEYDRGHALQVVMEGCVLNGVSSVVFDTEGTYSKLDSPNPDTTKFTEFGMTVDPIGMPVRRFTLGTDMFIPLWLLDADLFGDITGMGKGKASELAARISKSRRPSTMQELIGELAAVEEKESKYHANRAIRVCRLMEMMHPRLFDGKIDPKEIVAPWLKKMGRIAIVNVKGLDQRVLKGVVYALLKTVYESYKEELASGELKVEIGVELGKVVSGKKAYIDREIEALVKLCSDYGIGISVLAQDPSELDKDIVDNATLSIQCMGKSEIGVKSQDKRVYRAKLRPTLSAYVTP